MAMLTGNSKLFKLDVMLADWLKLGDGSILSENKESATWLDIIEDRGLAKK